MNVTGPSDLISLLILDDVHQYLYWNPDTNVLVVEERVNMERVSLDVMHDMDRDDYRSEIRGWKKIGYTLASTSETDLF